MQDLLSTLNDAADGVLGFLGDLGDYGHERVTKTRIRRVQGYIVKWEAKVKTAKSGFWKDRAQRKLDYYKRQLREMQAELKKDMERREGKGKDWRYDKTRAAMLGLDKKKKKSEPNTADEAYTAAGKEIPKGLNKAIFQGRIKAALPVINAATARGQDYRFAVRMAVQQTVPASLVAYRAPLIAHFEKYQKAYTGKAGFQAASPATLQVASLKQAQANRDRQYQQMVAIRSRLDQLNQQRAAASAADQQRIAQMQAQYQQQLAAMQAQFAQLQSFYAQQAQRAQVPVLPPSMAPVAPVAAPQPQERSGAFQAFPYSTALEAQAPASAPESAEAEGSEGAEGAEEAEDTDTELGEESEETPFYKNPAVIVGALVVGAIAYNQINKKKGKGQGQSTP